MNNANALAALGIAIDPSGCTEQRLPCPRCDHGPRDDALGVNIVTGAFHCFRCGFAGRAAVGRLEGIAPYSPEKRTTLGDWGRELWTRCQPISGVARQYLEARRCYLPPPDGDLRWHPQLHHPGGHVGPGLVALVTHAVTGEPLTLHRTWIRADGNKANVEKPRLLLAGHGRRSGVIRLWPDDCVDYGLAVAEGIETALSAAHVHRPIWSCIDAGGMETLPVLPAIEVLTIYADNDDAGTRAARLLGQRWAQRGRDVAVITPLEPGLDINDIARRVA